MKGGLRYDDMMMIQYLRHVDMFSLIRN